jgi:AraC-like DNA-binding protein
VVFLSEIGAPVETLLQQARVPVGLLNDPEGLVPLFPIYRFIELAARQERLEDLGVVAAQRTSTFDLGAYGVALQGATTVHEYLRIGIRLIGALSSGTRFWLDAEGDHLRINHHLKGPASFGRCVADAYTLMLAIDMLRRFVGPEWSPEEVRLMVGVEPVLGDWVNLGGARLITGQRHSSFTLARSLLNHPVPRPDAAMSGKKDAAPASGQPMPADFVTSSEQLVLSLLADGYPGIHAAAEAAGMTARTLQRRLADVGFTYSGLVAAARTRQAIELLTTTEMPIAEIAAELGYTDQSNFGRAFRRRTGMSPLVFRRR